jgi:hypothetical protein
MLPWYNPDTRFQEIEIEQPQILIKTRQSSDESQFMKDNYDS